ncbi:MAG TPA: aldehyde dehydrogenase family protein, partial [Hyphomicrobiaceae bacterium]|nr:aldehyde dehydrogenase family protein [Hyphomicrobiaceae bacterium]
EMLMRHKDVAFILATGGASMVKAAYSSGKPAIGVGPGNAPTFVAPDADLTHAAASIVASKSFDNGLICGSEHNLVTTAATREGLVASLAAHGAAVLAPDEVTKLTQCVVPPGEFRFRPEVVGQSAAAIAKVAGITRPHPIGLLVVPTDDAKPGNPWAHEKMAPMVSLFTVADTEAAIALAQRLLEIEGKGHTAIIHTRDRALARRYGLAMPASRILVNSPGSQGIVGHTTNLKPSFTLGCGTFGGNSTTDNVTFAHLLNVKRLAEFVAPPSSS